MTGPEDRPAIALTSKGAPAIEARGARVAGLLAWLIPLAWLFQAGAILRRSDAVALALAIVPLWAMVVVGALYYGHIALRRFRPPRAGLATAAACIAIAGALGWLAAGWEAGVTVLIAACALLPYAWTWSEPAARLLGWTSPRARAGLFALGLLAPFGPPCLALAALLAWLGWSGIDAAEAAIGLVPLVPGLALVLVPWGISRRARAAARAALAALEAEGAAIGNAP